MADFESGTHEVAPADGLSLLAVEAACREVSGAAVVIDDCLEFLEQLTSGEPRDAVEDAQIALRRIRQIVDGVRASCAVAGREPDARAAGEP